MNKIIKITLITMALSISGAGLTSHLRPSSGCAVIQQEPKPEKMAVFKTLKECREEVQRLIKENNGLSLYIEDSNNTTGNIETYFPGISVPIYLSE